LISTPVSAILGVETLVLGNLTSTSEVPSILLTWWLGDFISALIVAPFILLWVTKFRLSNYIKLRPILESLVGGLLLFSLALVIFGQQFFLNDRKYPISYLLIPPLIWVTFRLGYLGAITATLGLSIVATGFTLSGQGLFVTGNSNESLILLQIFMGTIAVISLILAAVLNQHEQADGKLKNAYLDLEEKVKERTAALETANKALIQADKQREVLVSIASHELRTPVTSIKGYTQMLQRRFIKAGDEVAAKQLGKMDEQIDKLMVLIQDLLDVTKIRAGRMELNKEIIVLDNLVREATEEMRRTTDRHAIIIQGETNKYVKADKIRLNQVLTNLLSNAIKYSPEADKIIVTMQTDNTEKSVIVCIQDFGLGVPQENREYIFDLFYRIDDDVRKSIGGFGLGLFIASEIIKSHNGRMWLENSSVRGSSFCFSLPIYEE